MLWASARCWSWVGLYATGDDELLVAYYSGHEYPDSAAPITHGPADIYLASLSV